MPITNTHAGTRIDEIADRIFRISTPVPPNPALPPGFTFNQFLIVDDDPLLFHTGLHKMFPLTREAVAAVMPVDKLRWVSFSHFEADECGALSDWLAVAPNAAPLCGTIAAAVSVADVSDRPPRALADGELLALGTKHVRWLDAPHLPHGWDAGYIAETTTRTLFCGDLFTQGGADHDPVTERDLVEPSEAFRRPMDYFSHAPDAGALIEKLAATEPALLACMHGASYRGDGSAMLRALATRLAASPR